MKVSVVIPVFNEEENLIELTSRLTSVLSQYDDYEVILVDDGSSDKSVFVINAIASKNNKIKLISLSRNFGHQEAISAGLSHATGDAVMVMDGDLQDPPEVIPDFVNKWKEGYEVVYAIREKRKENIFKKIAYASFYRLLKHMSPIDIPLDSGDFGLMDKRVVSILNSMPEKSKFVRGIRTWIGFRQVGLSYERNARAAGNPKFTFRKLVLLAIDGITSTTTTPIKISSYLGMFFTGLSGLGIIFILYRKLFTSQVNIEGWTSSLIVTLFLFGIQFLLIGIQGQYIGRIFNEVKARPQYIIGSKVNFDNSNQEIKTVSMHESREVS